MRHGVKAVVFAATQANANRLRDGITSRIPANAVPVVAPRAAAYHDGRFYAVVSILTVDPADADAFHAAIQAYWTSGGDAARALAGSESRRFQSFSDEPSERRSQDVVTDRKAK